MSPRVSCWYAVSGSIQSNENQNNDVTIVDMDSLFLTHKFLVASNSCTNSHIQNFIKTTKLIHDLWINKK